MWLFSTTFALLILTALSVAFPSKDDLACQDFTITLLCPGEEVAEVQEVMYGRQNSETCTTDEGRMLDTDCSLPSAFKTVSELCNNKSICDVPVSSKTFSDPCPGTDKYLTVKYTCLKFMFTCFGPASGVKGGNVLTTDLLPQTGIMVKDPLSNLNKIYFATWSHRQNQIKEYANNEDFSYGSAQTTYILRSGLGAASFVVFDGNLYYVKEQSCNIVKYGLMLRRRIHEISVGASHTGYGCNINLAVDEYGLWAIYQNNEDNLVVLQLDAQNLGKLKSFNVDYRFIPYLHKSFMLCGVLYIVGSQTGVIEYQFDTGMGDGETVFLGNQNNNKFLDLTNISSLAYNPRNKEFYAWHSYTSRAYVYNMFLEEPVIEEDETLINFDTIISDVPLSTKSSTTPPKTTTLSPEIFIPVQNEENYCLSVHRHGLVWPMTKVGLKSVLPCPLGIGENASWECVRDSSLRKASWHIAGPNLIKCATWVTDIETNFDNDRVSEVEAVEDLKISLNNQLLDEKYLPLSDIMACIKLSEKLLKFINYDNYEPSMLHLKASFEILDTLIDTVTDAWDETSDTKSLYVAQSITDLVSDVNQAYIELKHNNKQATGDGNYLKYNNFVVDNFCLGEQSNIISLKTQNMNSSKANAGNVAKLQNIDHENRKNCSGKAQFIIVSKLSSIYSPVEEETADGVQEPVWRTLPYSAYVSMPHTSDSYELHLTLQYSMKNSGEKKCVAWEYLHQSKQGFWNADLCETANENSTHVTCVCEKNNGLFTVLLRESLALETDLAMAVNIVAIGLAFCTLCLSICLIAMICTRDFYFKDMSQKHLLICLLLTEVSFIIGSYQTQNDTVCKIMSGCLQFFLLASFLWVMLDAVQLYVTYVRGSSNNKSLWVLYSAVGYGVPSAVVAVSASVDLESFQSSSSCWIRSESMILWAFVVPLCSVVFVNMVVLSVTLYKMFQHRLAFAESARPQTVKMAVRGTSLLLSLLSFNWAFGIMWLSEQMAILGYLFAIFNIFQGLFMLLFRCIIPLQRKQPYQVPLFGFLSGFCKPQFSGNDYSKRYHNSDDKSMERTYNSTTDRMYNSTNHIANNNSSTMDYKW